MTVLAKGALTLGVLLATSVAAMAECPKVQGSVRILSNDFAALHAVVDEMDKCAGNGVEITKNQNKDFQDLQVAALKASPSVYTSVFVANDSLPTLLNEGLVRPLDQYVTKYGANLKKNQLISVNGKVMAVAFMVNAQHLYYRQDILDKAGLSAPKTYEDVLAAAKVLKDKGLVKYPLVGTYKAGWNLAAEFVNMYFGYGGTLFEASSPKVSINNEKGVKALETLKSLTEYMNPDYLTFDSNAVSAEWKAGNAAIMNMWGSRAPDIFKEAATPGSISSMTKVAAAPTVGGGSTPASTLWWDGFSVAKNVSDADADATFAEVAGALTPDMMATGNDKAVWLVTGYKAQPTAAGVSTTAEQGGKPYPVFPYMGLLHTALGDQLVGFFQGKKTAEQALSDVEAAYSTAATQAGFLK